MEDAGSPDKGRAAATSGPGCVVWDCGIALSQSISRQWPIDLKGRRVLELGSGTGCQPLSASSFVGGGLFVAFHADGDFYRAMSSGIAGIVAAANGADVVLTDQETKMALIKVALPGASCNAAHSERLPL